MNLTIYRHTPNTKEDRNIIGDLHVNDEFFCYSLEDEIRPDGVKVYGKTAIPAGEYEINVTWSNRFKRNMPLLLNVEGFRGVRLHGGNDSSHSHGCPLVAFNTDGVKIWGTAEKELTKLLTEAENNGEKNYLTIRNSFLSYDKEAKKDTIVW